MIKQIIFILKNAYNFQNFKIIKINWKMIIKYPSKSKLKPDLWNSKIVLLLSNSQFPNRVFAWERHLLY